jgi:integrase
MPVTRQRNDGLRKICACPRRQWAKCSHVWHFNYKWGDIVIRKSLDGLIGRKVTSKTEAEHEAERLRIEIREGRYGRKDDRPALDRLTVGQLLALYAKRHLGAKPGDLLKNDSSQIKIIKGVALDRPDGQTVAFGEWFVRDVTADALEQFQSVRRHIVRLAPKRQGGRAPQSGGAVTANRNLTLLRAAFNWAVRKGVMPATPFKRGTESVVRLTTETPRSRRLEAGEADRLLAACGAHLRALVEAALETGCRKGELLSLQWSQVRAGARPELFLPAQKTKTGKARTIPVSGRLNAILEMRRLDPDGNPHPPAAYVFGNEIGQRLLDVKTAWRLTCQRAKIEGLHFHDLRREAGSRWLEGGVQLHTVKTWLGHANISQTSTYLATTFQTQHDAMRAFEQQRELQPLATGSGTGGRNSPRSAEKADGRTLENMNGNDSGTTLQ